MNAQQNEQKCTVNTQNNREAEIGLALVSRYISTVTTAVSTMTNSVLHNATESH